MMDIFTYHLHLNICIIMFLFMSTKRFSDVIIGSHEQRLTITREFIRAPFFSRHEINTLLNAFFSCLFSSNWPEVAEPEK